jgi:hypothetical protein
MLNMERYSSSKRTEYEQMGMQLISQGKVAILQMAGG